MSNAQVDFQKAAALLEHPEYGADLSEIRDAVYTSSLRLETDGEFGALPVDGVLLTQSVLQDVIAALSGLFEEKKESFKLNEDEMKVTENLAAEIVIGITSNRVQKGQFVGTANDARQSISNITVLRVAKTLDIT